MLASEVAVVKPRHSISVKCSRYRETRPTDSSLVISDPPHFGHLIATCLHLLHLPGVVPFYSWAYFVEYFSKHDRAILTEFWKAHVILELPHDYDIVAKINLSCQSRLDPISSSPWFMTSK